MKRKRIAHYVDERETGHSLRITLKRPYRFTEDGEHVRSFDTWKEATDAVNATKPCKCRECDPEWMPRGWIKRKTRTSTNWTKRIDASHQFVIGETITGSYWLTVRKPFEDEEYYTTHHATRMMAFDRAEDVLSRGTWENYLKETFE